MMTGNASSLVVLLHGHGGNGDQFDSLRGALQPFLPHTRFVAPDAPSPSARAGGFQWFGIDALTEHNRGARIEAARPELDRLLAEIIGRHGLSNRLDRVALIGFSQGADMALDALATARWPVGALVSFAGRLLTPGPLRPPSASRTLLVHGDADPVIPHGESERAHAVLRDCGAAVELHVLPGIGHVIPPEGLALACQHLAHAFALAD